MVATQKDESSVKTQFLIASLILAAMAVILAGCAAPFAGRLQSSPEATQIFKRSQILPDHQYYVSGFQRVPYAIIAVDNNYQLQDAHWQPIDMDSAALNQVIYRMQHVYSLKPRGAWILDQEGKRLGVWYSSQYHTLIKREKDNRIVVVSPEPPGLRGIP